MIYAIFKVSVIVENIGTVACGCGYAIVRFLQITDGSEGRDKLRDGMDMDGGGERGGADQISVTTLHRDTAIPSAAAATDCSTPYSSARSTFSITSVDCVLR